MSIRAVYTLCLLMASLFVAAQNKNLPAIDKSPLDISFFPNTYPLRLIFSLNAAK
jgi:hypothetical protein